MERIQTINPARIQWCCDEAGITVEQLASDVKISLETLALAMAGERGLTFKQLVKVAAYFGRGILFFLEPGGVDAEHVHTPQFRTLTNKKPLLSTAVRKLIERTERQRDVFVSLREELDDGSWPRFQPPHLPKNQSVAQRAATTREWLGLNGATSFDDFRSAVEDKGILVFRTNGYAGKWQIKKTNPILGFCLYDADCPVIVVKKQDAESRQSFTLFHELGHLLLHRASSIDEEGDLASAAIGEPEANEFAGRVLVTDALLATIDDAQRPQDVSEYEGWLAGQRAASGASTDVLLIRLIGVGRLAQARYNAYRQWYAQRPPQPTETGGARGYRHREPRHIFGDRFVRAVLDGLQNRQITLPRASRYLDDLTVTDVRLLEQHYADL